MTVNDPPQERRIEAWWLICVQGADQLRQRVAFALSQIFVVSEVDLRGSSFTFGLANYYDMLAENAFGNFRDILEGVTLSPIMGIYLSSIRNEKPDPARNIRPDENYARELMQLFSIGLVELNQDGTVRTDSSGQPIPTYDQAVIEGMAHVFTGWTYAGTTNWNSPTNNRIDPMEPIEAFHDTGSKQILGGINLPPNQTAEDDLEAALDAVFQHANVAPFICKQLIQRMVTSNPSPAYVRRVSNVFNQNEDGIRGDMMSVIRAILLDPEALNGHNTDPQNFWKLKEPLLKLTHLWRAFDAIGGNGLFRYTRPERDTGQGPLRSPTVFNFYRPDYQQPGEVATANMDSPEFQILTESNITNTTNRLHRAALRDYVGRIGSFADDILINIAFEKTLANNQPGLVDHLDLLLLAGQMSPEMRLTVLSLVDDTPLNDDGTNRVIEAIFIIITSPEFAVQR